MRTLRSMRTCAQVGAALLLAATAARAGVVVQMSGRDLPSGPAKPSQVFYAQSGMFRIDRLDAEGHVQEIQLVRDGVIWEVNVPQRTFRKVDKQAVAARMGAMQGKMQGFLQNLPPEQRAALQARMTATQSSTVTDTGHNEHVGSYSCEVWQVARRGKVMTENCIAPKGSLKGGDELVSAAHAAAATATDVLSGVPQQAQGAAAILALYGKMDGFPVLVRHMSGGKASREETVTSIDTQALPADKFAIPRGFNEVSLEADGETE